MTNLGGPVRVLWLSLYPPWPPRHGGKIRLLYLLRAVLDAGHDVELWIVKADGPIEPPQGWTDGLTVRAFLHRRRTSVASTLAAIVSAHPLDTWESRTPELLSALRSVPRGRFDAIIADQSHTAPFVRHLPPTPWVLNGHNVESTLSWELAKLEPLPRRRLRFALDALKLWGLERRAFRTADAVIAVSEEDHDHVVRVAPDARVVVAPNGVDIRAFPHEDHTTNRRSRIVMTGNLAYLPNRDAAGWVSREILPAVRAQVPEAEFHLVGANPGPDIRALHDPANGFHVVGEVPSVQPYMSDADAFLVPLRLGGGTKLKVVEALASGVPTVGTPKAMAGLGVEPGDSVLVAEDTAGLATQLVRALHEPHLRSRLSDRGRAVVEERYSWSTIGERFVGVVEEVVRR